MAQYWLFFLLVGVSFVVSAFFIHLSNMNNLLQNNSVNVFPNPFGQFDDVSRKKPQQPEKKFFGSKLFLSMALMSCGTILIFVGLIALAANMFAT